MMSSIGLAVVLSGVLVIMTHIQSTQKEYTLKLNLKEGDTFVYDMKIILSVRGELPKNADIDLSQANINNFTYTQTTTWKVLRVEENGNITMEVTMTDPVLGAGEFEMARSAPLPRRITLKPNGEVVASNEGKSEFDEGIMYILPKKPVKVGDQWSHVWKTTNPEVVLKSEFKFVGVEKLGEKEVLRIEFKMPPVRNPETNETTSMEGFILLDPSTGMARRIEYKMKGTNPDGTPNPIETILLFELKPK